MKTPTPIIEAYVRRIERGEITLNDIKREDTRNDVKTYMETRSAELG